MAKMTIDDVIFVASLGLLGFFFGISGCLGGLQCQKNRHGLRKKIFALVGLAGVGTVVVLSLRDPDFRCYFEDWQRRRHFISAAGILLLLRQI